MLRMLSIALLFQPLQPLALHYLLPLPLFLLSLPFLLLPLPFLMRLIDLQRQLQPCMESVAAIYRDSCSQM